MATEDGARKLTVSLYPEDLVTLLAVAVVVTDVLRAIPGLIDETAEEFDGFLLTPACPATAPGYNEGGVCSAYPGCKDCGAARYSEGEAYMSSMEEGDRSGGCSGVPPRGDVLSAAYCRSEDRLPTSVILPNDVRGGFQSIVEAAL